MKQLENKIKLFIDKNGPISFEQFMEFALYDKYYGYYTNYIENIGKLGDYYTSPAVHAAFGEIISAFIHEGTNVLDAPVLSIVELGSGRGYLALDILNSLKDKYRETYDKINYICIEISDRQIKYSKKLLGEHKNVVKFKKNISEIDSDLNGFILSNELFDSIPFHRIKFYDTNAKEIYVDTRNYDFVELALDIKDSSLLRYIDNLDCVIGDGQQIELCTRYEKLIKTISNILESGFILSFDYGYLEKELYNPKRCNGTYRCFYKHKISDNPYINIGHQDITCSINFSSIIELGSKYGMDLIKYVTQGQFLIDWGILDIIEKAQEIDRATIKNLILPNTMGDKYKALLQGKNLKSIKTEFYPESKFIINYQSTNDRV